MAAEHSNPSIPHAPDRRPAMWPWLLMPIAALTLYVVLYSVRQSAPPSPTDSSPPPAEASAPAPDTAPDP